MKISQTTLSKAEVDKVAKKAAEFEQSTWPELERLARDIPEAGLHFQGQIFLSNGLKSGTDLV